MINRILSIALLMTLGTTASPRTLELIEGAYELVLSEVIMPINVNGTTFVRSCVTCPTIGIPVTPETEYHIDGRMLPLPRFREEIAALRVTANGNESGVGVFYGLDSGTVTRIKVYTQ